jgi:hypothetical protein
MLETQYNIPFLANRKQPTESDPTTVYCKVAPFDHTVENGHVSQFGEPERKTAPNARNHNMEVHLTLFANTNPYQINILLSARATVSRASRGKGMDGVIVRFLNGKCMASGQMHNDITCYEQIKSNVHVTNASTLTLFP